jgi:hypothetical protein
MTQNCSCRGAADCNHTTVPNTPINELLTQARIWERSLTRFDGAPRDYDEFLAICTDIHVTKNHDYDSRFMKGLLEHGGAVYFWEASKKLDRLRTWLERGELRVKGEGITNSVQDLFVYTVQYMIFKTADNPLNRLSERDFYSMAASRKPEQWMDYWRLCGLIKRHEEHLQMLILRYMGVPVVTDN